jgi:hypothetical protein
MNRGLLIALAATLAAVWYASGLEEAQRPNSHHPPPTRVARYVRRSRRKPMRRISGARRSRSWLPWTAISLPRTVFCPHLRRTRRCAPQSRRRRWRHRCRSAIRGVWWKQGGTTVFLTQGDRMLVARAGDLLGNQYRVESVSASAVTFIFEPLKQRQTLTIGSAK